MRVTLAPLRDPYGPLTYTSAHQAVLRARMLDGTAAGQIAEAHLWLDGHSTDTERIVTSILGRSVPALDQETLDECARMFGRAQWAAEVTPGEFAGEWALVDVHERVSAERPVPPAGDLEGVLARPRKEPS